MPEKADGEKIRIDKWLWAARFFKTRSSAAQAVNGGRVHLNGGRVKPAKTVGPGDQLQISRGEQEFVVHVLAVSGRRRPAVEARQLYEETADSIETREKRREMRRLLAVQDQGPIKRPGKRDRRRIKSFTRNDW